MLRPFFVAVGWPTTQGLPLHARKYVIFAIRPVYDLSLADRNEMRDNAPEVV